MGLILKDLKINGWPKDDEMENQGGKIKRTKGTAKHGKRLGEVEKLAVIAQVEGGLSIREVARRNNMSQNTIRKIREESPSLDALGKEVDAIKKGLSRKVWRIGDMLADSVINHPEVIENAALSQRMVGLGIAVDKGRLMDGEPTEITKIHDEPMGELMNKLGNILRRAPLIGVEVTRMMASIPEEIRGATMREIEERGLISKSKR
jgi:hypothetical protein